MDAYDLQLGRGINLRFNRMGLYDQLSESAPRFDWRELPHDGESEKNLLGAYLMNPYLMGEPDRLGANCLFAYPRNAHIHREWVEIWRSTKSFSALMKEKDFQSILSRNLVHLQEKMNRSGSSHRFALAKERGAGIFEAAVDQLVGKLNEVYFEREAIKKKSYARWNLEQSNLLKEIEKRLKFKS